MNGRGNATQFNSTLTPLDETHDIPTPYTLRFDPKPINGQPKRYLLRIINTSFASTFIFSIDNHLLQIVGADFVPIENYSTPSILVAIGQRYHVIVEADPQGPQGGEDAFWIRTIEAGCTDFTPHGQDGYNMTGVLRYTDSQDIPKSVPWPINVTCTDEDWDKLVPKVSWQVGKPANGEYGENLTVIFEKKPSIFPLAFASIGGDNFNPMYLDYSKPTFLHLNYTGLWDPLLVVFKEDKNNASWVSATLNTDDQCIECPAMMISIPGHLSSHDADRAIGLFQY